MTDFVSPAAVGGLSDEEWVDLLDRSLTEQEIDGIRFPAFPDEQTQANFVGASQRGAIVEAMRFVRYVLDALAATGGPPPAKCSVVDFGSGWGRITRTLLRDFRPEHVVGVDPIAGMVHMSHQWFDGSPVAFEMIDNWPPLDRPTESVDLIVAYSVFSHLPERVATAWIAEFARVLRPGGIVVATTHSRSFIGDCERLRMDPSVRNPDSIRDDYLARSFTDADASYRRFDAAEFLYAPNGGGEHLAESVYGDALFSGDFVARSWGHLLTLVRFEDKPNHLPQAAFVVQKPRGATAPRITAWRREDERIAALEADVAALRASESFRIGQLALAPVRMARRVRRRLDRA